MYYRSRSQEIHMEKAYWLKRELASLKLARSAGGSEAGMIHYDLAGRYSVKAAEAGVASGLHQAIRQVIPAEPRKSIKDRGA
jgi:hypothetical protein